MRRYPALPGNMSETGEITRLLHAYAGGDRAAFDELVPLVYDELRRFFAGLSEDETAQALGVSLRTAQRNWMRARAWIRSELTAGKA